VFPLLFVDGEQHGDAIRVARLFLAHTTYQHGEKYTKLPQNIQNGHKIYQIHSRKIDQMVIKYSNIFHYKTFKYLPKLGFLV
jgi:hypothetical protein